MRASLCLIPLLLACSSSPAQTDGGSDSAVPDDGGGADVATEAGAYLPAGYTEMAFISDTPVHKFTKADQVIDGTHSYVGVLDTDQGRIVMDLLTQIAPLTTNSFVFLTLNHFYDGVAFHRVIDGFMAQTGDPNSISGAPNTWGQGGCGYTFNLEPNASYNFDSAGVVGMARLPTDVNSNGSQFFITFAPYPGGNQQYTVWAKVTEGLDVLPNIVRGEPPAVPTRILDAYIGIK